MADVITAVYSATRNIYGRALNAMRSLLRWHPDAKIYLLTEDEREVLANAGFDIPEQCMVINAVLYRNQYIDPNGPNMRGKFPWQVILRAAYPEIFKEPRILGLDCDTIVCYDLTELWNANIDGKWFAAVAERELPRWRRLPYQPQGLPYFNFGVVLYNNEQMRKDNATAAALDMLNRIPMDYAEQDAFNALCYRNNRVLFMPNEYNNCIGCGYTDRPYIMHYAGVMTKWLGQRDFYRWELLEDWHGRYPRECERFSDERKSPIG